MTERGIGALTRDRSQLSLGRSALALRGDALEISIDEICAPVPRRLKGIVRLTPTALGERSFLLDPAGSHRWTPFAPCARVEVQLDNPSLRWSGVAYMDCNAGTEPLEHTFKEWTWSRASLPHGTVVLYDVTPRQSDPSALALRFGADAVAHAIEPPPLVALPTTGWRIKRRTRADAGHSAQVVQTLEDAPFYSRSLLRTHLLGATAPAIHESLNLDRFATRWVQCLLPFRMPRRIF